MFLLALDCSTSLGSLALAQGKDLENYRIIRRMEFAAGRGHGGALFAALEQVMNEVRAANEPLEGILVGLGPGSYSGVRQAIAASVGLATATGAWLEGVPSVVGVRHGPRLYQTVGDARRGAFYYAAVHGWVCITGPELLPDAASLQTRLAEHRDWPVRVMEAALPDGLLADATVACVDAGNLLLAPRETHWLPPLEPIYLRPVSITLPKAVP